MNFIYYLLLPLFFLQSDLVQRGQTKKSLTKADQDSVVRVFSVKNSSFRSSVHSKKLRNYTLMQLDTQAFQSMRIKNLEKMDFEMPFNNSTVEMELTAMQIFDQSFKVTTDQSKGRAVDYSPGKYYVGKIIGDPTSIVTISIFENEMSGIISSREFGNLNLGTSNPADPGEYILYGQDEIKDQILFDCSTTETPPTAPDIDKLRPQIDKQLESRAGGCVTIDFELTNDVYKNFGNNVTNSTNWITTLFTGVKALYQAEGIEVSIKSVYVWTTEDDYADDVSAALTTLGTRRKTDPAFTGTLVHLVRGKSCSGGCSLAGIAWLNVLCNSGYRFGVSEPIFTYSAYPAYSWSINVLTHELGHNMGSNHTHWCGWSGGPIDNCAPVEGGSCGAGPTPAAGKGTIMSYCHQQGKPGISFANGFGPLPGAAIRARYNAVTCLSSSCGGSGVTPTCTDGIKNGTETGVDCGGTCTPCVVAPTCTDGIQNGTETGIDCGGPCSACIQCSSPVNLSQGKSASQSTTYNSAYPASKAIDGATSFNHTNAELQPWWQVDLGSSQSVNYIQITNRVECCGNRIKRFRVFVTNSPVASYSTSGSVYLYDNSSGLAAGQTVDIPNLNATGRYVRIWVDNTGYGNNYLHLSEVRVLRCSGSSDPCSGNAAPSISLSANSAALPQGSTSFPRSSNFNLNATVNDPGGSVSSVEFYSGSTLLGTDNSSPFSYTMNSATSNSYNFTAKAIDNCNASATSSQLTVTTTVTCSDGYKNGNETGVDCGGSCTACTATPTCTDGIQNGTETGIDCGGNCTACVTACASPINLSQGKTASQSSNYSSAYPASKANDGASSFNHTGAELQPWWQVDLGSSQSVNYIQITNRVECCGNRIKRFKVFVSNSPVSSYSASGSVYVYDNSSGLAAGQIVNISNLDATGRYVRIWVDNSGYGNNYLHLSEVRVMRCSGSSNPCSDNTAPTISLSANSAAAPQGGSSFPRGSSFNINATANDPDGTVNSVEFYSGSTLLGTDNISPFSFTMNSATSNSYNLTAKAFDDCDAVKTSAQITVTTTVSCSDGYQNGTETGVDCGGNCTACSEACASPNLLSQGKSTSQSSTYGASFPASRLVDGSNTNFNHTGAELQPWWQVDLGGSFKVSAIEIRGRADCCGDRIKTFKVFVSSSPVSSYSSTTGNVYTFNSASGMTAGQVISISNLNDVGRYVRIWVNNGSVANYLHLAEVKVSGCSATGGSEASLNKWDQLTSEVKPGLKVNVFPNPVKDLVNFEYSIPLDADLDAMVFDVSGRRLLNSKITDNKLDLSNLENGSYFIHLNYKGQKIIKKVLKF